MKMPDEQAGSAKNAGFNTVRSPAAWFCHSDTLGSKIDKSWMSRVKEVVDYCIKDDLYVIINMHWHKGWLENRINRDNQQQANKKLNKYDGFQLNCIKINLKICQ